MLDATAPEWVEGPARVAQGGRDHSTRALCPGWRGSSRAGPRPWGPQPECENGGDVITWAQKSPHCHLSWKWTFLPNCFEVYSLLNAFGCGAVQTGHWNGASSALFR